VIRLLHVLRLELGHALRRPLYWVLLAILGLMSWGLSSGDVRISSGDSSVGGLKAWITSEFAVAQTLSYLTLLLYSFFVAVAAGFSIIRDDEARIGEILHATPLRPREYVWGKFLAVLVTFGLVVGAHLALMAFFNQLWPSEAAEEIRGPFHLSSYLRPAAVFVLPLITLLAGFTFWVGERTRRPILVVVLPVALLLACAFFLWEWAPAWLDPAVNRVLMLVEPAGFRWLNETHLKLDRGVEFYNTQPIALDAPFLVSRLVMVLIGLGCVGLSVRHFERTRRGRSGRPLRADAAGSVAAAAANGATAMPAAVAVPLGGLAMTTARPGLVRGILHVARVELRELAAQPGLYIFVPLILLQTIGSTLFRVGAFSTPLLWTPGTLAVATMNTLTLLSCLLMLFYTVESLERERATGLHPVLGSSPLRTASLLFGKALANSLVGVVMALATLVACVIALLIQGKVAFDPWPFVLVWGCLLAPTFIVWTAFVTLVLSLCGNRYTTYAVGLGALILTGYVQLRGKMSWVGNWDIWSVLQWSDMGTFEINRLALLLNRTFVLSLAVLFTALTVKLWPRRERDPARTVVRLRPASLLRGSLGVLPFMVVPALTGGWLWHEVNVGFQGKAAEKRAKDYWRKNVNTWKEVDLPAITDVDVDVDLEPSEHRFSVTGAYTIRNHRDQPLQAIPVTTGHHWSDVHLRLDGVEVTPEDRIGLYVLKPQGGLQPGAEITLGFSHAGVLPKGITKNGGGLGEFVLPSSVLLTTFGPTFVPVLGFVDGIGVDEENRSDAKEYLEGFHEGVTQPLFGSATSFSTRITITAPEEYGLNAVGVKERDEVADGRRTVAWVSDRPVRFFNIVAGRWAVKQGDGTTIYYHPEHGYNVEEMSACLDAARRRYSEWFYPYPWQELKLSQFPALAGYAQGHPTNITFSENIGFLTRSDPKANAVFLVTAHETAHQWWGNILTPGKGPGGNVLSEGMSHFATILLFEAEKGLGPRIATCKQLEKQYGDERRADGERSLAWVDGSRDGDTTVTYDKGGWVAWMLLQLMGREAMLEGCRDFIERYHDGPDFPVIQDFVVVMRGHAPDAAAFDAFTAQWYFDVVVSEYRITDAKREREGEAWRVQALVTNRGTGEMPVDVAAVSGDRFDDEGAPLTDYRDARLRVVLGAGESADVDITCDFEPARLVVDPDVLVLQLSRSSASAKL
jgi:ABC-type transport system involved in multi-copper enzyme maturation permease subunit